MSPIAPPLTAAAVARAATANRFGGIPLIDACYEAGISVGTLHRYDRPAPLDEAAAVLELVTAIRAKTRQPIIHRAVGAATPGTVCGAPGASTLIPTETTCPDCKATHPTPQAEAE